MYAEVLITRENKKWSIKEHALIGFSPEGMEKHRIAQRMLETVVNSWEFRQELLAASLTSTRGMSNSMIYNLIINGNEIISPIIDFEADISVHAYRKSGRVVGYTYPDTDKTWLNLNFFDKFNYAQVANNLFHEWLHKLGFDHRSASEKTSIPYAAGKIVETLAKKLMKGEVLHDVNDADKEIDVILGNSLPSKPIEPVLVCFRSWRNLWRKKCYYL